MTTARINKLLMGMRRPRVTLTYRVEFADPAGQRELPFVLGVLADLSGHPETPLPGLLDRHFLDIDIDNFDTVLAQIAPKLTFSVEDKLAQPATEAQLDLHLRFRALDDFSPESVAAQVPALAELLERRRTLNQLRGALIENYRLATLLDEVISVQNNTAAPLDISTTAIEELIVRALFSDIRTAKEQLCQMLAAFISELAGAACPLPSIDSEVFVNERMRVLDRQLSTQVNAILHSKPFQQLESAWRGLHYLVSQTESGSNLKLRVLNITKKDLRRDLLRASAFDTSILFKKVHDDIYGSHAGQPFAAFILDFAFGPQPEDIQILSLLSNIAAAINAPCIAAASPEMLDLDNFTDPIGVSDLARLFEGALYTPWRRFRESEDSRYIALALPRILLRLPYGSTGQLVEAFDYQEDIFPNKRHHYLWGNAAYAFGTCLTAAFSKFGWCAAISGIVHGAVDGLPSHFINPQDDGTIGPAEVTFNEKQEFYLVKLGFLPLSRIRATNQAVFFTAHSCYKPKEYDDASATATSRIFTRLDYLLCACRFTHYLRCMLRDALGHTTTPTQWETYFNDWISQYVLANEGANMHMNARRPLSQARIEITELPAKPNIHAAVFYFHPHFQLEDPPVAYRIVATLPAKTGL